MLRSFRPRARPSWAWLLWLGLVFAFAQTAASAHAISHFGQHERGSPDGGLVHAQCDLCLLGASIGGAAPAVEPAAAPRLQGGDGIDIAPAVAFVDRAPALAYRSRAPPAASR